MARRVRFFSAQIDRERDPIYIRPLYDSAPLIAVGPRAAQTIDDLDVTLSEHESRLLEMNDGYEVLSARLAELLEARHVLRETAVFFQKVRSSPTSPLAVDLHSPQAETTHAEIRSSFDDSSAPLLQHDDRENQYSAPNVQLDLEYGLFLHSQLFCPLLLLDSSPALSTAPVYQRSSASSGASSVETST